MRLLWVTTQSGAVGQDDIIPQLIVWYSLSGRSTLAPYLLAVIQREKPFSWTKNHDSSESSSHEQKWKVQQ